MLLLLVPAELLVPLLLPALLLLLQHTCRPTTPSPAHPHTPHGQRTFTDCSASQPAVTMAAGQVVRAVAHAAAGRAGVVALPVCGHVG